MRENRRLTLRREILVELEDADLLRVVGGEPETWRSCLTYMSCFPTDCT